jgi:hypothetical protein
MAGRRVADMAVGSMPIIASRHQPRLVHPHVDALAPKVPAMPEFAGEIMPFRCFLGPSRCFGR